MHGSNYWVRLFRLARKPHKVWLEEVANATREHCSATEGVRDRNGTERVRNESEAVGQPGMYVHPVVASYEEGDGTSDHCNMTLSERFCALTCKSSQWQRVAIRAAAAEEAKHAFDASVQRVKLAVLEEKGNATLHLLRIDAQIARRRYLQAKREASRAVVDAQLQGGRTASTAIECIEDGSDRELVAAFVLAGLATFALAVVCLAVRKSFLGPTCEDRRLPERATHRTGS